MTSVAAPTTRVALIGNPNTGKSTLFSALSGVRQRVGNYPGVTVEKKIGRARSHGQQFELVDLPGTYSLAPRSPDEMVAVDVLLGRRSEMQPIEAVLCVVDASNLERNLYLVSQVLELGLPTVIALNMVDVARERGLEIDVALLSERLGVPVIEVQANRRRGVSGLLPALAASARPLADDRASPFPPEFQREVRLLESLLEATDDGSNGTQLGEHVAPKLPRYLVERLLLDAGGYLEKLLPGMTSPDVARALAAARRRLAEAGCPVPAIEAAARYRWASEVLRGVVRRPVKRVTTRGDRIDRILTHKVWGTLLFAAVMLVVFSSVFAAADPLMGLVDRGIVAVGEVVSRSMSEGPLRSLIVDGVIGGVGSVLIFLPQIVILFFFIAVLGGLRLHCPRGVFDGQAHGWRRPERQVVHPVALFICLCSAGHHGDASD